MWTREIQFPLCHSVGEANSNVCSVVFGENLYSRLASVLNWHMFVYTDLSRMMILVYSANKNATRESCQRVFGASNNNNRTQIITLTHLTDTHRDAVVREWQELDFRLFGSIPCRIATVHIFSKHFLGICRQFPFTLRLTCGDVYLNLIRCQRSVQYFARWFSTFFGCCK